MNLESTRRSIEAVREQGGIPRVHPNGFIQLDLIEDGTRIAKTRLHVWPDGDNIPKQDVVTTIHDHRFDMGSTVIKGDLYQQTYEVKLHPADSSIGLDTPTHQVYMAQYPDGRKESQLISTGINVWTKLHHHFPIVVGQSYWQPRYTFHDTQWVELTATIMQKSNEDVKHEPRVLVPLGQEPDNTFVRSHVDLDLLWDYIERATS